MIYTVTFNPSLDYIVRADHFAVGEVNRTTYEQILEGGKGLNVSVVLKNMGLDSVALGFTAGFTGEEIERRVAERGVSADFVRVEEGMSRINVKLKAEVETELNGQGPHIEKRHVERLYEKLEQLKKGDILVLAGSIPNTLPDDMYERIMERLDGRGIRIVVDATRELLTKVLPYHPFLIKPNHHELGEIFHVKLSDKAEIASYAKKLPGDGGAENVLVSMAGDGAVLVAEDGAVYECPAPRGKVVNSVGAGDSMVAGFLTGYLETGDYQEAFLRGAATGSASAFSEQLATREEAEALLTQLEGSVHMKTTDLLKKESIELHGQVKTKEEAIERMVELMVRSGNIRDENAYKQGVLKREAEGTTGIGGGIAIPHAKNCGVAQAGLSAMVVPGGVDYDAMDGAPVDLLFLIAAPDTEDNVHLQVLSQLAVLLMDGDFTAKLRNAKSEEEFLRVIDEAEKVTGEAAEKVEPSVQKYQVLAVTACPTGIAHTYMAAENLEKTAEELGYTIKVETNGAVGVKNRLTDEEIQACDGIIVAVDKQVEMARFDGKPVLITSVSSGIHDGEKLIRQVVDKQVPVYHSDGTGAGAGSRISGSQISGNKTSGGAGKEHVVRKFYKHLMNGVSYILPLAVGSGCLVALAYLLGADVSVYRMVNGQKEVWTGITAIGADGMGNPGTYPMAMWLLTAGMVIRKIIYPVMAGFIAMSIADRPGLVIGLAVGAVADCGFLGAVAAGFLGGGAVLAAGKACSYLPESVDSMKPMLFYPLFGILISGMIMTICRPWIGTLDQMINRTVASCGTGFVVPGMILGAVLGGMMSADMGGPLNKTAYVFGVAQVTALNAAASQYQVMAAVMAGGMVPPLGIALCTTFFPSCFTEEERKKGKSNYMMGLTFNTEGAIPFAEKHACVRSACLLGSAVGGALSMFFGCGVMVPHGGIFVIWMISNPIGFLAALAAGSVVTMMAMSIGVKWEQV